MLILGDRLIDHLVKIKVLDVMRQSEKAGSTYRIVKASVCPVVVALWQNTGGSNQVSWVQLLATAILYFASKHLKSLYSGNLPLFTFKRLLLAAGSMEMEIPQHGV